MPRRDARSPDPPRLYLRDDGGNARCGDLGRDYAALSVARSYRRRHRRHARGDQRRDGGRTLAGTPAIREIDLDPVIVHPVGQGALDAQVLTDPNR